MNWKEVFVGAAVTLLVTIGGGFAVEYFKKASENSEAEKILFTNTQVGLFRGTEETLALNSVKIWNAGGQVAKNVTLVIRAADSDIKDFIVTSQKGLKESNRQVEKRELTLNYDVLLPKDEISIDLLLTGRFFIFVRDRVTVSVRSAASVGEELKADAEAPKPKADRLLDLVTDFMPIAVALGLFLLLFILIFYRSWAVWLVKEPNNSGFLLLHSGLPKLAQSTFERAVIEGKYDQYTLSNFALCSAALGDLEKARNLMWAAEFRKSTGHTHAVVLFNFGIINLIKGEIDQGVTSLKAALSESPKEIRRYFEKSKLLDPYRALPQLVEAFSQKDVLKHKS